MTVGEARKAYSYQLREYNKKAYEISEQQKNLQMQIKYAPESGDMFQEQLDALQIDYDAVKKKYDEYQNYMNQIMGQWEGDVNSKMLEQQTDAAKKEASDMSKLMTVARRMMKGDNVPGADEKKLMEYNREIYQICKNMQMMAQLQSRKHKNHKSLWEDEEQKEYEDPIEYADSQELQSVGAAPEIIDVDSLLNNDKE